MAHAPIDELDAAATLRALEEGVRARRRAEVEDLLLVARWADLMGTDPGQVNRPGSGGGSDPTEGWSHASTEEVPGRAS